MKLLFSTVAAVLAITTNAQESAITDMTRLQERALQFKLAGKDTLKRDSINIVIPSQGGRVRILPQDGMPCIVPDTSGIASMPNAFSPSTRKESMPGRIPNPAPRIRIEPYNGSR